MSVMTSRAEVDGIVEGEGYGEGEDDPGKADDMAE